MNQLVLIRTRMTPEINFNGNTGILKISGRAFASDISVFYKRMEEWLDVYLKDPNEITIIELEIEYCNSIFSKLLFGFFAKAKTLCENGKKLQIKWFHELGDSDSKEDAVRISRIIDYPIETVEILMD